MNDKPTIASIAPGDSEDEKRHRTFYDIPLRGGDLLRKRLRINEKNRVSLRSAKRKGRKEPNKHVIREQAMELAQLAYDVFTDKKQSAKVINGQNHANHGESK